MFRTAHVVGVEVLEELLRVGEDRIGLDPGGGQKMLEQRPRRQGDSLLPQQVESSDRQRTLNDRLERGIDLFRIKHPELQAPERE